ncbi:SMI1/KNR4 family protein [Chondrinema litorale]|uniref:SMI1/KNR4 family protein n=1 Tax=Chondrinema litorale TaxID=2994555 RepID=UPI0025438F13|nr:SMI1/KNR4 family protein [Chondrinema litorale]UZR95966.1 SMI1/KNR4 family protein [Chondrinema litorale]
MTPTVKLKSILDNQYKFEDGDAYRVELLEGMNQSEIEELKRNLPNQHLPTEIEGLLKFCRGFEFYGLEEVRFDSFGHFGFEEVFPNSIQLTGDGFGNFWILDIDSKGNWNEVYYVCHDPAVIVKHSNDLTQFIEHVDEFGRVGDESNLDIIHEQIVFNIWNEKVGIWEQNERDYDFESTVELPESFLIADLTNEPIQTGFAWGKFGVNSKIIRPTDEPIWIVEKKIKQGFLARLFNRSRK